MAIETILNGILNEPDMRKNRQNIVDGIEQVYEDATSDGNTNMEVLRARGSEDSLNDRLNDTENQLEQKVGGGKLAVMGDLGQDIKIALTGGSVAVVGANSTSIQNLASDLKTGLGEFNDITDSLTWNVGYYNIGTNAISATSGWKYAEINATKGDMLKITGNTGGFNTTIQQVVELDSDGNKLDGFLVGQVMYNEKTYAISSPDCSKAIVTFNIGIYAGYRVKKLQATKITDRIVDLESKLTNQMIESVKVPYDITDLITWATGYYNIGTSAISPTNPWVTAYIEAKVGDVFRITGNSGGNTGNIRQLVELNGSDVQLSDYLIGQTTYNDKEYIIKNTNTAKIVVVFNSTVYPEYKIIKKGYYIAEEIESLRTKVENRLSKWNGKIVSTQGDSVVGQEKWQKYLENEMGCTILNVGVGGTTVSITNTNDETTAISSDTRVNAISTESDAVLMMGFANDFGREIPLGSFSDTTPVTAYGSMKQLVKKLILRFPTKKIIFITTPFRLRTTTVTNNIGLTIEDYNDVTREVCKYYHIPVIDLSKNWGINEFNYTTFMNDDVHPNELGGKRMAEIIIPRFEALGDIVE